MSQLGMSSQQLQEGMAAFSAQASSAAHDGSQALPRIQHHHHTQAALLQEHTKVRAMPTRGQHAVLC